MNAFFVTVCGLVILLGFEIRYRSTIYEISLLKIEINKLGEEILKLKAEMKLKQNIYEEHGPST
jgi:FtsZ-binding cell division protein ZapB